MRVLYLTIKPIYPIIDGGCAAMASFLKHLIKLHEYVDHLTIETYKHPFNIKEYQNESNSNFSINSIYVNTKISTIKAFFNLFSKDSYNVIRFYSKEYNQKLIQLLKNDYEVIYLESIYLLPYIDSIRKNSNAKIILRSPNIEYKIWENHTNNTNNLFKKWYLKQLTKKLKNFEINNLQKVDGILTISNIDAELIKKTGIKTPILNLPFSIETGISTKLKDHTYFFIGAYNWLPNLNAVLYLLKTLFPKIKEQFPDAKLHIAGSYMPKNLYDYTNEAIFIHGKVDSVKDFMKNHGILLAPITSGSGVRIKILEALSFGIPVIGSKIAIQGINSSACFVAENENDYLNIIKELTQDKTPNIQEEAINYINKNYNSDQLEKTLNEFIKNC